MTTGSTQTSLCRRALLQIGARSDIASLQENSTEANACSILFQPVFEQLARSANWNSFRAQSTLSLLAAAQGTPENPDGTTLPIPPQPWLYQYATPSNNLQIRFLLPTFQVSTGTTPQTLVNNSAQTWVPDDGGQIDFVVAYTTDSQGNPSECVLTNQTQAQAVYTVNQSNPVVWDSLFEQAFVSSLSAFLVPALSLQLPLMQMCIKTAETLIEQARVRDGDEGVTVMDHLPDWIRVRASGTTFYGQNGFSPNIYANTFYQMAWPSY